MYINNKSDLFKYARTARIRAEKQSGVLFHTRNRTRFDTKSKTYMYKMYKSNIDLPLIYSLFEMEEAGIKIDISKCPKSLDRQYAGLTKNVNFL